jgi:hypothetical protein
VCDVLGVHLLAPLVAEVDDVHLVDAGDLDGPPRTRRCR